MILGAIFFCDMFYRFQGTMSNREFYRYVYAEVEKARQDFLQMRYQQTNKPNILLLFLGIT